MYLVIQRPTAEITSAQPKPLNVEAEKAIDLAIEEENWDNTRKSIQRLLDEISKRENILQAGFTPENVQRVLVQSLCNNNDNCSLDYSAIEEDTSNKKVLEAWAKEIYFYQQKVKVDADGIIGAETSRILKDDILITLSPDYLPPMSQEQENQALNKFNTTRQVIQEIFNEIVREVGNEFRDVSSEEIRYQVIGEIKRTLKGEDEIIDLSYAHGVDLSYGGGVIERDWEQTPGKPNLRHHQKKWVEAIYRYQKRRIKSYENYGYLEPGSRAANKLKSDVGEKVRLKLRWNERNLQQLPQL